MTPDRPVRTRFAPSPTGEFHVGGLRTALFTWLTARNAGGQFVLRIEDTDQSRYDPGALSALFSALRYLGLDWDEGPEVGGPHGPYFQSQRLGLYGEQVLSLLNKGAAYRCFCTGERLDQVRKDRERRKLPPGYDRHCRDLPVGESKARAEAGEAHVVRLKIPVSGTTVFSDLIRGEISYENDTLQDIVLMKSDGFPTYHFANVVDDHFMEITHVTRASEWIPSTPLHVLLYAAFDWKPPVFAHLPVILDPSGKGKMSKRKKEGSDQPVHVKEFIEAGYLSEAMLNYLALLGWNDGSNQTEFSREELIARFDVRRVNPSGAAFDYTKLDWMNGVYIRKLSPADFSARLGDFLRLEGMSAPQARVESVAPLVQERIRTLREALPMVDLFFDDPPPYTEATLIPSTMTREQVLAALEGLMARYSGAEALGAAVAEEGIRGVASERGVKVQAIAHVARVALGGRPVGPPLFESVEILGRDVVLRRLAAAQALLG